MGEIRVVLADDHPVVRSGIRHLLERTPDIKVVGETSDGPNTLELIRKVAPDMLLLDMEMPGMLGVEVAREVGKLDFPVRILALSAYDDEQYIFGLLEAGAAGYLTKEEAPDTIVEAVRGIMRGEEGWISRRVAAIVMRQASHSHQPTNRRANSVLNERELQVLRLLAHGQSNSEIAAALFLTEGSVKNLVTSIYNRLGLRTRAEAVAWAWQNGIVEQSSSDN